ncbi:MAG: NADH-quinone oxidoreductase subunit L, partial [Thermoanaerobaculaceae bacterium]
MLAHLWLLLALPLAGALVLLFGALRFGKKTTTVVGVGSIGLTLLVALATLGEFLLRPTGKPYTLTLFRWLAAGSFSVDFALRLDGLSAVMVF